MHRNLHICRIRPKRQIQQKPLRLLLVVKQQQEQHKQNKLLVKQQQIVKQQIVEQQIVEQQQIQLIFILKEFIPKKFLVIFLQQEQLVGPENIAQQQFLDKPKHRNEPETAEHRHRLQQLAFLPENQQQHL